MYQYIRMNEKNRNDLQEILTQALNEIKDELGEKFNIDKVNLAELERRTGLVFSMTCYLKVYPMHLYVMAESVKLDMQEVKVLSKTMLKAISI